LPAVGFWPVFQQYWPVSDIESERERLDVDGRSSPLQSLRLTGTGHSPHQLETYRLLDHLIRARQHRLWVRKAKRLCGFQVDHETERRRSLDRNVGGAGAVEDLGDQGSLRCDTCSVV
jgi:hypothetical protein